MKESTEGYFLVKEANKNKNGGITIMGRFLANCTIETDENNTVENYAKIKIPKPPKIKWILPPVIFGDKLSKENYNRIKKGAQAAGYETLEFNDIPVEDWHDEF